MTEKNTPTTSDKNYGVAATMGLIIDNMQKLIGSSLTTIERKTDTFPKILLLRWIPEGIEIAFAFTDTGMSQKVFEPENIADYPVEYQTRIQQVKDELSKLGFSPPKEEK